MGSIYPGNPVRERHGYRYLWVWVWVGPGQPMTRGTHTHWHNPTFVIGCSARGKGHVVWDDAIQTIDYDMTEGKDVGRELS